MGAMYIVRWGGEIYSTKLKKYIINNEEYRIFTTKLEAEDYISYILKQHRVYWWLLETKRPDLGDYLEISKNGHFRSRSTTNR